MFSGRLSFGLLFLGAAVLVGVANTALAEKLDATANTRTKSIPSAVLEARQGLEKQYQGRITSIKASAIPGLYEVVIPPRVLYISEDGRYTLLGDMMARSSDTNLTQPVRDRARVTALENVGEDNMIVFAPEGEVKHTISVFTDIDCGYCRKLHNEMDDYNKLGIKVRYLAYPRAGIDSKSYQKAVTVWCSDNKKEAMTRAKNGKNLANKTCDNPVKDQMVLGKLLGVRGTPAIMLENGQLYPGYAPAKRLIQVLNEIKTKPSDKN